MTCHTSYSHLDRLLRLKSDKLYTLYPKSLDWLSFGGPITKNSAVRLLLAGKRSHVSI